MYEKFTGDLDAMVERRLIRVIVPYNRTIYFLDKDTQRGIAYDSMKAFEEVLNKKRKLGILGVNIVFVALSRDQLLKGLVDGKGDVAIGNLTITPERQKLVDFTVPAYKEATEIVVTGPDAPKISSVQDLSGKEVFVRKSSSYFNSLQSLNVELKKSGKPEVILKEAPENLEDEDLMEMANAGLVKILVVDKHMAEFWKQMLPGITLHPEVTLRTGGNIAWAIRKNSPQIKAELSTFIATHGKGTMFGNMTLQKYLKNTKFVKNSTSPEELKKYMRLRDLFVKYGDQYDVDWLLMAAQGYQESRLDQNAKSHVGAVGVMQVMPATGKDMNVGDISQIEPNINAGIKYMRFMINQYYKDDPPDILNKMLFSFASYNCGPGRMRQLRKETEQRGLNPDVWFNNVERVAAEKVGRETVNYVSNIYKYYIAYKIAREEKLEKEKAKQQIIKQ